MPIFLRESWNVYENEIDVETVTFNIYKKVWRNRCIQNITLYCNKNQSEWDTSHNNMSGSVSKENQRMARWDKKIPSVMFRSNEHSFSSILSSHTFFSFQPFLTLSFCYSLQFLPVPLCEPALSFLLHTLFAGDILTKQKYVIQIKAKGR